ncbi:SDR family NAD(P)-dependent oxidoreductase [Saccharopolyspora sp. K220]|uniref:SDR family NAD(P)-dependent oxidoreductase n=1 Tax=Saccharopolyspora soli TaxID=2926618 RepID=UPI001F565FD5|nr:SDR family NAD(P)-dependent oxidoreductase [Saccharopolyspora soli]MCI2422105.1 SDR family NAD(P)-dependent oxidoreductase [Saccharopolyspora soli]
MPKTVLVTSAAGRLGAAVAQALALAGHTAYAGFGSTSGPPSGILDGRAREDARLRPLALDVADQRSVSAAISDATREAGQIDVVIHTVGSVPRGPVESFTPYQLARIYDAHVLSAQRVNRAVLPLMRARQDGLLVWVVPLGRHGEVSPYLALHSEAVTVIDHLAASYAKELTGFGIETSIVVSGSLLDDSGQHPQLIRPDDVETAHAYEKRYPGLADRVDVALAAGAVADTEIARAARVIAELVDSPKGSRPPRVNLGRLPADG